MRQQLTFCWGLAKKEDQDKNIELRQSNKSYSRPPTEIRFDYYKFLEMPCSNDFMYVSFIRLVRFIINQELVAK